VKHEEAVVNYADSIFELTFYEEPRPEDTDFLVPCLFALVNEPKPHIKGDLHSLRSQYIRVFVLKLIQKVKNQKFLEKIFGKTVEELYQACQDRAEFPNSWVYKKKIRMAHLLCSLAPWCRELCRKDVLETNVKILIEIVKLTYVHSARQYIERFLIVILLKYPELTTHIQVDYDMRPQLAGSFILILGAVMVFSQNIQENSKIFSKVLPFMISNTAHIRRTCHFVIFKFLSLNPEFRSTSSIFEYLYTNKECQKMMKKLENSLISFESLKTCDLDFILSGHFSDFDEIIHNSLIAEIDEQCKHLLDLGYDVNYQEVWKNISQEIPQVLPGASNFQRKVEDTQALVELRTSRGVQQRHELVIVASLVDKLPNLAGLTRTSEVFNLQLITMAVKNVLNDSEFKSMAVTADKWLPIMEVGKSDLEKFLRLYRQKGYKIIGLEQTANSISMEKFKFISKSVLVLGHEKDGIPSDLLSLLDACLEIPQFGLIRSLNVHVSASICIWEYMKQLYLV
jgi:tRNA G18 (ribose-2'-O)-methylase SpoU